MVGRSPVFIPVPLSFEIVSVPLVVAVNGLKLFTTLTPSGRGVTVQVASNSADLSSKPNRANQLATLGFLKHIQQGLANVISNAGMDSGSSDDATNGSDDRSSRA
jgi:hypothetical protein